MRPFVLQNTVRQSTRRANRNCGDIVVMMMTFQNEFRAPSHTTLKCSSGMSIFPNNNSYIRTEMNGNHDIQKDATSANDIAWLGLAKFSASAVAYSLSWIGSPDLSFRIIMKMYPKLCTMLMTLGPRTRIAKVALYAAIFPQSSLQMYASSSKIGSLYPRSGGQHSNAEEIHVKAIQHWHLCVFQNIVMIFKVFKKEIFTWFSFEPFHTAMVSLRPSTYPLISTWMCTRWPTIASLRGSPRSDTPNHRTTIRQSVPDRRTAAQSAGRIASPLWPVTANSGWLPPMALL